MKQNMGSNDRFIRVMIAVVIGGLWFTDVITGTAAIVLLIFAGLLVLSSFAGVCPMYKLFGINTCSTKPGRRADPADLDRNGL